MTFFGSSTRLLSLLVAALFLTACSVPEGYTPGADGINDPYEKQNRNVHQFNVSVDRSLLRPVAIGYTRTVPNEIQMLISNFSSNFGEPSDVINSVLQGDMRGAGISTARFAMNTTVGIAGLIDAASAFGIPENDTDFGETLHVWGAKEGPYIEVPILGPSTRRDSVGRAVDFVTNPLGWYRLSAPESYIPPVSRGLDLLSTRGRYSETIDSILYDSADSYAQTRLIYLQTRRFRLGQSAGDGSDSLNPYVDPYEDPYAQ